MRFKQLLETTDHLKISGAALAITTEATTKSRCKKHN